MLENEKLKRSVGSGLMNRADWSVFGPHPCVPQPAAKTPVSSSSRLSLRAGGRSRVVLFFILPASLLRAFPPEKLEAVATHPEFLRPPNVPTLSAGAAAIKAHPKRQLALLSAARRPQCMANQCARCVASTFLTRPQRATT